MNRRRKNSEQGQGQQQSQQDSPSPSSPSPPSTPPVPPPPVEWEETPQCLGPILRHYSLPLVVMCDKRGLPCMENVNFDFSQPLLLHTRRTVRKVVASNILQVKDEGGSRLEEVGDRLLIPEDYKGWFAVLGPPEGVKPERVVPHFRQVAQLALSKCESFLIGGSEPVAAVTLPSSGNSDESRAQPRLVYPGDVLRMGKLYVGESTIKVKKMFGGKKTVKKEEKFLMCTDDKDREVYLPVESRGTFYMLTTEGHGTPKIPIMQMPDVCTHFRFPCVVKLLFGRVPSTPCSFTGTMVLLDSQMESSVIGCTMVNLRNILLDIPIDSDLKFFQARGTLELLSSKCYKNAKALCQDKASTYMRNMKVAYYIQGDEDQAQQASDSSSEAPVAAEEAGVTGAPACSPAVKRSASGQGFSRARSMSCSHPSIVEDQELFCPPEAAPSSPSLASVSQAGKKSRKSTVTTEAASAGDSLSTNSPTVLRKDQTYTLPEQQCETLPLRPAKSPSALSMEHRPLPPVLPTPQPSPSLPDGHYVTMEETADQPAHKTGTAAGKTKKLPLPPPKPAARKARPPDGSVYTQLWNGETNTTPTPEESAAVSAVDAGSLSGGAPSPNSPKSPPARRPDNLSVPHAIEGISSFALADTYLTVPMFKGGQETPARCARAGDGYLTPTFPSESEYKTPSNIPKPPSVQTTGSSSSLAEQQQYETMESVSKLMNGVNPQNPLSQVPPPPPPKPTNNHAYSNLEDVGMTKSKPLPPLPPLPSQESEAEPPGIVFANDGLSDTSSLRWSEWNSFRSCSSAPPVPGRKDSVEKAHRKPDLRHKQMFTNGGHKNMPAEDEYEQMTRNGGYRNMTSDDKDKNMSANGEYQNVSANGGCENVSAANGDAKKGKEADYMSMRRDDSFTYYEGYDPQHPVADKAKSEGRADLVVEKPESEASYENVIEKASSAGDSDEILYENVQNLRPCKERLSRSDSSCSEPSDNNNNHGHFLDKVANSATTFGYQSPPPARALTPRRRPFTKTPAVELDSPLDTKPAVPTSTHSAADPVRPPPTPPKPCGAKRNVACFSYLRGSADLTTVSSRGSSSSLGKSPSHLTRNRSSEEDLHSQELPRPASQDYDASSGASFEDDLPLGATFANFRSRLSDSGCAISSVAGQQVEEGESVVSHLSVADLGEALRSAGLLKETVDTLQREKVDGRLLVSLDEEELKEALPNVKKLEIKKIRMFVNGWRLME